MVSRKELRDGSREKRSFLYRPPDPIWVSTPHMADVRARLAQFDSRVTAWWGANRGRWQIMEWSNAGDCWRRICFWSGTNGEYRECDADGMIQHIAKMCGDLATKIASIEKHNEKIEREKGQAFRAANEEYLRDMAARAMGVRQTFAPGMIRSRDWLRGESGGHHRKYISQHLKEQWELRNGRKLED